MAGYDENVKILYDGYHNWLATMKTEFGDQHTRHAAASVWMRDG